MNYHLLNSKESKGKMLWMLQLQEKTNWTTEKPNTPLKKKKSVSNQISLVSLWRGAQVTLSRNLWPTAESSQTAECKSSHTGSVNQTLSSCKVHQNWDTKLSQALPTESCALVSEVRIYFLFTHFPLSHHVSCSPTTWKLSYLQSQHRCHRACTGKVRGLKAAISLHR